MAQSFGVDPERYDRGRPAYPEALVAAVVAAAPGPEFLDVGCGTGTEARQFRAAGCTVLGVEPDERMAAFARSDGLPVEVATFEDWDQKGRTFDAIVAGTAWHWVDPDAGAAKAAALLRPGGLLAPFWHVATVPEAVQDALAAAFAEVAPDLPVRLAAGPPGVAGYQPVLDVAADGIRRAGGLTEPEQWLFEWERTYSRDEWLDQVPTSGIITRLAPADREHILAAVGKAIDRSTGTIVVHYDSVVLAARRR
jgi:SAM-dependent methyltransferase